METELMMTKQQGTKPIPTKDKRVPRHERDRKCVIIFQRLFGISVVFNVALVVTLMYLIVIVLRQETNIVSENCPAPSKFPSNTHMQVKDSDEINDVFHDLTLQEIHSVIRYMYSHSSFNLNPSTTTNVSSSLVYSIELYIPSKDEVINYLTQSGEQPPREALVVFFHGDRKEIQEYVIGPLDQNDSLLTYRRNMRGAAGPVNYRLRQVTASELWAIYTTVMEYKSLHKIMRESFGATLFNCIDEQGQHCASMFKMFLPVVYSSGRMLWIQFYYDLQFYSIYPIDLQLLLDVDLISKKWMIRKVWYASKLHDSYQEFVNGYFNGTISKTRQTFPSNKSNSQTVYGSLRTRRTSSKDARRPPKQMEWDGKRYSIAGQTIRYLKWRFNWVNSLKKGPTLFNIQFGDEMIVYELGLQDIVILYTGENPALSRAAFADGFSLLGSKSAGLVPDVDCPGYATFINVTITTEDFHAGGILPNAMCLFEHNLARPLRRHYSTNQAEGGVFYGGLVATVLVLRTIYVINNYDYILDYLFYENGAIEVKIYPTGYILTAYQHQGEKKHGFTVGDSATAPMHLHLFHFKIDLDILGKNNRYQTLDIAVEKFNSTKLDGNDTDINYRYKMLQNLKHSELEAAYEFNFSVPKYHIVFNNNEKNIYGENRGYRIDANGFVNQLLPKNFGFESTIPWSRYQLAVTKQRDTEESSGSSHTNLDAGNPVVDFQSFIDDNENIVDEDLVFWLTLGCHHIPHSEDLPNTVTSGSGLSILLTPFNYFNEDPSVESSDAVYMTPKDPFDLKKGLNIEAPASKPTNSCFSKMFSFEELAKDGTSIFFPYS